MFLERLYFVFLSNWNLAQARRILLKGNQVQIYFLKISPFLCNSEIFKVFFRHCRMYRHLIWCAQLKYIHYCKNFMQSDRIWGHWIIHILCAFFEALTKSWRTRFYSCFKVPLSCFQVVVVEFHLSILHITSLSQSSWHHDTHSLKHLTAFLVLFLSPLFLSWCTIALQNRQTPAYNANFGQHVPASKVERFLILPLICMPIYLWQCPD